MLGAVVGLGVKHVEEHDGGEGQDVVEHGDGEQSCAGSRSFKQTPVRSLLFCTIFACSPPNQHFLFPSSAFCSQARFQEWAKSTSRMSWMMMKMKEPATPK